MFYVLFVATEESITSGMKRMEGGLAQIKAELKHHHKAQEWADKFQEKMKEFMSDAEGKFKQIKGQHELMDKKYGELSEYYCFDRKKVSMEEFFGDITQFTKDFEVRALSSGTSCLQGSCMMWWLHREQGKRMPR